MATKGPLDFNRSYEFSYASWAPIDTVTLEPGIYRFECWGAAAGASAHGYTGTPEAKGSSAGQGGYTSCVMKITEKITVYAYSGSAGTYGNGPKSGGWNGGGSSGRTIANNKENKKSKSSSGGGASDWRFTYSWDPLNYESLRSRFCVAGGGGGVDGCSDGNNGSGGSGGGLTSQGAWSNNSYSWYPEATQWKAGLNDGGFGRGGNTDRFGGGGGGGWFGGGAAGNGNTGGGGGSGYIKGYPGCNDWYTSYQGPIYYLRDGRLEWHSNRGSGSCKVTRYSHSIHVAYVNASGNRSTITTGETATATPIMASNQYLIRWEITSGFSFSSTSSSQAIFKPTNVREYSPDFTVTIKAVLGTYATLISKNCNISMNYIKPNTKIRVSTQVTKQLEGYVCDFTAFIFDKAFFKKQFIISDTITDIETDILTNGGVYYVEALYVRRRVNSDIYKSITNRNLDFGFLNNKQE